MKKHSFKKFINLSKKVCLWLLSQGPDPQLSLTEALPWVGEVKRMVTLPHKAHGEDTGISLRRAGSQAVLSPDQVQRLDSKQVESRGQALPSLMETNPLGWKLYPRCKLPRILTI